MVDFYSRCHKRKQKGPIPLREQSQPTEITFGRDLRIFQGHHDLKTTKRTKKPIQEGIRNDLQLLLYGPGPDLKKSEPI